MSKLCQWLDRTFYPGFSKNWDDQLFRERIISELKPDSVMLDLGAGAGIVSQMNFKGLAQRVCGVDLDPRVERNPFLDESRVSDAGGIPYPDDAFDLVVSDNVLEHLVEPLKVFKEVKRVLKPNGVFLFKTPNKWHYMPMIASLTPHSFHQFINRIRGRSEVDTFPTLYRANCPRDVALLAQDSGFAVERIELIEGRPEYLRMMAPSYVIGILYERLVNRFECLATFRILLVGKLKNSQGS